MNLNIKSHRLGRPSTWLMATLMASALYMSAPKSVSANETDENKSGKTTTQTVSSKKSDFEMSKHLIVAVEISVIATLMLLTFFQSRNVKRGLISEPIVSGKKNGLNIDYKKVLDTLFKDLQKAIQSAKDSKALDKAMREIVEKFSKEVDKGNSQGLKNFSKQIAGLLENHDDLSKMSATDFEHAIINMQHDFGVFKTDNKSRIFYFRLLAEILLPLTGIVSTQVALMDIFSSASKDLVRIGEAILPPIVGFTSSALFQNSFGKKTYRHFEEAKQRLQHILSMYVLTSKKMHEGISEIKGK